MNLFQLNLMKETLTQTVASRAWLSSLLVHTGTHQQDGASGFYGTEHRCALFGIFSDPHCVPLPLAGPDLHPS